MISTNKKITTAAATFGAALTSLYAAPDLQADVVDLTFEPSLVAPSGTLAIRVDFSSIDDAVGAFFHYNANSGKGGFGAGALNVLVGSFGQELSGATFATENDAVFAADSTGLVYVGFRTGGEVTDNVGWFSIQLGGLGGDDEFVEGEFGNDGENVTIGGTTAVPEPTGGALAALALGAIGLRRTRKS